MWNNLTSALGLTAPEMWRLPQGWGFFDTKNDNGTIYDNYITADFPAERRLSDGTSLYNAGVPGEADRALAIGTPRTAGESTIQLAAEVIGGEAKSIQLAFDVEAWDRSEQPRQPGRSGVPHFSGC